MEQTDGNIDLLTHNKKMESCIDSLSMVKCIVPNVHSFHQSAFFVYTRHLNQVPWIVTHDRVHHFVKVIKQKAFEGCRWLNVLELYEGLEFIRRQACAHCSSHKHIVILPTVKTINAQAFKYCSKLTTVQIFWGAWEDWAWCILWMHKSASHLYSTIREGDWLGCIR